MQLSSAPIQLQLAFGNGDASKTYPLPVPSQIGVTPGAASWTDGFPPLCATPVSSGGIPPSKADMNGAMFEMSGVDVWMSAGAGFPFSSVYAAAIGGYPKGARILNAAGNGYWRSLADNNSNNPDTSGVNWTAEWRAVASVYASVQQTIATPSGKVVWDTVESDDFGMWDAANQRFKAPWPGKYRLSGSVYLPSPAAQNLITKVMLNGALYKQYFQAPQVSSVPLSLPFDVIISAGLADNFQIDLFADTSSVLAGQVGSNEALVYGQLEFLGS